MFRNGCTIGISQCKESFKFRKGDFSAKLMFIVERPYVDFDLQNLDGDIPILITRTRIAYEFYVKDILNGLGEYYERIVVKEKLVHGDGFYANRCMFYLEPISQNIVLAERPKAMYTANDAVFDVVKTRYENDPPTIGYEVFVNGENIGFFSEFGEKEHFSSETEGIIHFDFANCAHLDFLGRSIMNTSDYNYEMDKSKYVEAIKMIYPHYVFNVFTMSDYTVVGVTDDESTLLVKSNAFSKDSTKQEYAYYEFTPKNFWLSKVIVKENKNKNGYLTSFMSEYLNGLRDYKTSHHLCGLSFEFIKGFSFDKDENIDKLYEAMAIGGEIKKYQEVEKGEAVF